MKAYLSLLTFIALVCCTVKESEQESTNEFQPRIFAATVSNVEASMDWYAWVLGFEKDTLAHFESSGITVGMLSQDDFFIELVGFDGSISKTDLDLPSPYSNLHGFFKMGFQVENIEALYNRLSSDNKINIIAPLDALPPIEGIDWPEKYFLIQDPDGNYIQFFSKVSQQHSSNQHIIPFLVGISTPDIDASLQWYQQHLGARPVGEKVGNSGNERALLVKDGLILEIGEFKDDVDFQLLEVPEGVWRSKVHGMAKLSFLVDDIQQPYQTLKRAEIQFDFDLTENKSMAGDRHFMVQDLNGVSLQFFEVDK